jgi:2-polyprenyl-6-methoxyphenol hydroxylase-like FAD-dependent oxidoreductase
MSDATDVLIVGAGPTGLIMAIQLARQGVRFRIIDKEPTRSDKSRALAVHARTLEILARMGLADELIRRGTRTLHGNINVNGRFVAAVEFGDIGVEETPYPFVLLVSQAQTEQVLETYLTSLGVEVERPLRLADFSQDDDGVLAHLDRDGVTESLRARYLVGADGAHSAVRHGCNMVFAGEKYSNDFILADVDVEWDRASGQFHFFLGRDGIFVFFPLPGERAFRLISTRSRAESGGGDPTLAEFGKRLRDHCQVEARLSHPRWLSVFGLHHRGVDRYRDGNAFVAGDAAHIHSPAGGQGMNTGMQDAWNLAWKLALVLANRANPEILDSYHEERHPVGQKLLRYTDRLFSGLVSRNWLLSLLRTVLIPRIAPIVTRSRKRRARVFRFVSQIGIRYRRSRLNCEEGFFSAGPNPGARAPDIALQSGDATPTSLHAQLDGNSYCLLAFHGTANQDTNDRVFSAIETSIRGFDDLLRVTSISIGARRSSQSVLVGTGLIDVNGNAHRRFGIAESGLYLIRPDDHIAFRCQGINLTALGDYLVRFLLIQSW